MIIIVIYQLLKPLSQILSPLVGNTVSHVTLSEFASFIQVKKLDILPHSYGVSSLCDSCQPGVEEKAFASAAVSL